MIATNTIGQGDSRLLAFGPINDSGEQIIRAYPSMRWPSKANVHVAIVFIYRGRWDGLVFLDDVEVPNIDSHLSASAPEIGIQQLAENGQHCFIGSKPMGMGWFLSPDEAESLLSSDPRHSDLVMPILNGKEINSRLDHSPERWALTFYDWPLQKAQGYPDCMKL